MPTIHENDSFHTVVAKILSYEFDIWQMTAPYSTDYGGEAKYHGWQTLYSSQSLMQSNATPRQIRKAVHHSGQCRIKLQPTATNASEMKWVRSIDTALQKDASDWMFIHDNIEISIHCQYTIETVITRWTLLRSRSTNTRRDKLEEIDI